MLLVCIYVDHIVIMGSFIKMVFEFKENMKRTFDMSDLGLMSYFLGLEVKQSDIGIHISQPKYTRDLLRKFNMSYCNPMPTPMNTSINLQVDDDSWLADAT